MPRLDLARTAGKDLQAEHAVREFEQSLDHPVHREVRPQDFLVEIITCLTQLFGPERQLPRRERANRFTRSCSTILLKFAALAGESSTGARLQIGQELQGTRARFGHPAFEQQISEMR